MVVTVRDVENFCRILILMSIRAREAGASVGGSFPIYRGFWCERWRRKKLGLSFLPSPKPESVLF